MSFFTKLMGGTFESNRDEGDALLADGRLGEAKLAYERALRKADRVEGAAVQAVRDKIAGCRIDLARRRIADADALAAAGEVDDAREKLKDALEVCDDPEIAAAVQERRKRFEAEIARHLTTDGEELSEEELLAVIAGTWTDAQADEYAALPDAFREGLLAAHDGDHARAVELMARALAEATAAAPAGEEPERYYAHLELGLEEARAGLREAAVEHLERFAEESAGDEEAAEKRALALHALARVLVHLERFDDAEAALVAATETLPKSHAALMALGVFLRDRGRHDGAVAALEKAAVLMGTLRPDFAVVRELGLTYLAAGNQEEAERHLYAVIEHSASLGEHEQIDPLAALPLAKLYEEKGELDKAANLFRHLAVGFDTAHHFTYNAAAARLLAASGADAELVLRYLARAEQLADTDERRAVLAALRDKVGA